MIWVRIGEINLVFPDEETMMRVLRSAEIKLEDVSVVEKRD